MKKSSLSSPQPPLLQWLNRHMWVSGCDLEVELLQARDEGRDLSGLEGEFERLKAVPKPSDATWRIILGEKRNAAWLEKAGQLIDQVQTLPFRKDFAYME